MHDDPDVLVIDSAPHHWLFPRVAAVVHHGGAGTTAAGLLAARPTVVCPFQGDQHFWGAAVHRAGAGPQPLPAKKLTPSRLAFAIRAAINDPTMQTRIAGLAERIAQEDGARASEQIETILALLPPVALVRATSPPRQVRDPRSMPRSARSCRK